LVSPSAAPGVSSRPEHEDCEVGQQAKSPVTKLEEQEVAQVSGLTK